MNWFISFVVILAIVSSAIAGQWIIVGGILLAMISGAIAGTITRRLRQQ